MMCGTTNSTWGITIAVFICVRCWFDCVSNLGRGQGSCCCADVNIAW